MSNRLTNRRDILARAIACRCKLLTKKVGEAEMLRVLVITRMLRACHGEVRVNLLAHAERTFNFGSKSGNIAIVQDSLTSVA